ncbi:MAG TPA: ATP-dependent Clp protease proteolytic subunit [Mycobacteriales bacterium]|nr:ATP-dependent Clp protease proteolytic subunit [Mycobacteriales bacterium]
MAFADGGRRMGCRRTARDVTMATTMKTNTHEPPQRPLRPPEWSPPLPAAPLPTTPDPHRAPAMPMIHVPAIDGVTLELLRRRIVVLTGTLDSVTSADMSERLLLLDADKTAPITMHFSCTMAELDPSSSLAATIEMLHSETTVIAVGAVERAAVGVFATAKVRRAHPHATFLLQDPVTRVDDTDDVALAADVHQRQIASLHQRVAVACRRGVDTVASDMQAGLLLSAAEAVDYGLVQSLTSE